MHAVLTGEEWRPKFKRVITRGPPIDSLTAAGAPTHLPFQSFENDRMLKGYVEVEHAKQVHAHQADAEEIRALVWCLCVHMRTRNGTRMVGA